MFLNILDEGSTPSTYTTARYVPGGSSILGGLVQIIHKKIKDLTYTEYLACYKANYGEFGYMRPELARCKREGMPGQVIMLWDGPDDSVSSLMGWALMVPVRTYGLTGGSWYTKKKAKFTTQFWVKKQYRRLGYGTKLMSEVKKIDPRPHVFPHDKITGDWFSGYDVTVTREDSGWLNRKKPKVA